MRKGSVLAKCSGRYDQAPHKEPMPNVKTNPIRLSKRQLRNQAMAKMPVLSSA